MGDLLGLAFLGALAYVFSEAVGSIGSAAANAAGQPMSASEYGKMQETHWRADRARVEKMLADQEGEGK